MRRIRSASPARNGRRIRARRIRRRPFDTRKTVNQLQGGATIEQRFGGDTDLRVTGYGGTRQVRQYLALPGTATDVVGRRHRPRPQFRRRRCAGRRRGSSLAGRPVALTLGRRLRNAERAPARIRQQQRALGDLRRDEDDTISNTDGYLQLAWSPLDALSLLAGVRYSDVRFRSDDHYVNRRQSRRQRAAQLQPTEPGARRGLARRRDNVNVYANYGQGFETPAFTELAYRPSERASISGCSPPSATRPKSASRRCSVRSNALNLAAFNIETTDEIVIDTATGGRTTYKNAAKTRRRGVEAAWEGNLGAGFAGYASYT